MYDLLIIGGGPAGVAAGVYASRKQLRSALLTEEFGGQSTVSTEIQNWIGTVSVSGSEWAQMLEKHLRAYAGEVVDIKPDQRVKKVSRQGDFHFVTETENGETWASKGVLVATGSHRRKLTIPGAEKFDNKGVTYCASCDGPLFAGQEVVVVGGGNAGFETALELLAYAKQVTLLHHGSEFKADPVTVKKALENDRMTALTQTEPTEIKGGNFVETVAYRHTQTGEEVEIPAGGVFVEIGLIPNTDLVSDLLELNEVQQIVIDPWTQQTSEPGIWAAGDCSNVLYHQNNIAAGDGVRALEDIYKVLSHL